MYRMYCQVDFVLNKGHISNSNRTLNQYNAMLLLTYAFLPVTLYRFIYAHIAVLHVISCSLSGKARILNGHPFSVKVEFKYTRYKNYLNF